MDKKNKYVVLFASCMLLVVGLFSMDLYNPSLPSITQALHVTQSLTRGLVVAYLFGFAVSQLIYGPFSDSLGRKKIIIISLLLTILGNLLTSTASSGSQLLFYRFLTGIGAGGCPVISRAILRDFFQDKKELTKAFSIFAMAAQISPSFAPIIGGFIEEYYTWQINFVVLSAITAFSLMMVVLLFKETNLNKKRISARSMLSNYGQLLSHRQFISYSIMSALVFSYTIGYYTINPFIFQWGYSFSPFNNGMIYILYSVGLFIGSYATKKLTNHYNPEKILTLSVTGLIVTSIIMSLFTHYYHSASIVIAFSSVIAVLCGLCAPILISLSILPFSKMSGTASALQGTIKMIGTAVTLLALLFLHVNTGAGLSVVFSIISMLIIPFIYLAKKAHLSRSKVESI